LLPGKSNQQQERIDMPEHILDIVFDGPPGPTSGRFIEVEDCKGRSVSVGKWIDRGNGYWALRIDLTVAPEIADPLGR
jgi:hypothetical protein